jgi:hypothetical protein
MYLTPELKVKDLWLEENLLTTGENLNDPIIIDDPWED